MIFTSDIVSINELTLILKIIGQCDAKGMTDVTDKNITTSITARPNGLASILMIMSVSISIIDVILYIYIYIMAVSFIGKENQSTWRK